MDVIVDNQHVCTHTQKKKNSLLIKERQLFIIFFLVEGEGVELWNKKKKKKKELQHI